MDASASVNHLPWNLPSLGRTLSRGWTPGFTSARTNPSAGSSWTLYIPGRNLLQFSIVLLPLRKPHGTIPGEKPHRTTARTPEADSTTFLPLCNTPVHYLWKERIFSGLFRVSLFDLGNRFWYYARGRRGRFFWRQAPSIP